MEFIVHIGTGKAGSSSIQAFCSDNREWLADRGVLYPLTPGKARHERFGMFVKSDLELAITPNWHRQVARTQQPDPTAFRRNFRRRLRAEIDASGLDRVLLSDEELFGASEEGIRRLGWYLGKVADRRRLVVYLRRQDDHLVSRYQQGVKIGWVARLVDWAREDFSGLYDYARRLRRHQELVSPDAIVVRPFEPHRFVRESLYSDFLDAIGVADDVQGFDPGPRRNESLDAETVEFLRLLNLHRVEVEGATPGLIDNRPLVRRLAEHCHGPILTLPGAALDSFMAQWESPNRQVARRFLDEGSTLFTTERKSSNTTSVQRLDPGRLDHFLAVGEIPEDLRAPLRRLAEREAR